MTHFQIDRVGNTLFKDLIMGWTIQTIEGNFILLKDFNKEGRDMIIETLPQHKQAEVRKDIEKFINDEWEQEDLDKPLEPRHDEIHNKQVITDAVLKERINEFLTDKGCSLAYTQFLKGLLDSPSPLERAMVLREKSIHTGWLADLGV